MVPLRRRTYKTRVKLCVSEIAEFARSVRLYFLLASTDRLLVGRSLITRIEAQVGQWDRFSVSPKRFKVVIVASLVIE